MTSTSLVIGASGQVGEHCLAVLSAVRASTAVGTYHRHPRPGLIHLDVTDPSELDRVAEEHRPAVIFLTGCEPNVDYCEAHPEATYEINVLGVRNVVDVATRYGSKLVFMSSEYLFDGAAGPYDELAPAAPLSVYGWQKLIAEHYIAACAADWLIIRTGGVYSWESQGKNFLYRLRRSLLGEEKITVPVDQISTPTYAPDLVLAMSQLVARNERGVFNVCGPDVVSRYDFALAAADAFGLDRSLIVPVATADLHQRARRPLQAGLTVQKVERALGRRMLAYAAGLQAMAATAPAAMERAEA